MKSTNGRLTHQQIREVCGAKARDKEMTCPCCGHSHLQLFGTDGVKCQNDCTTEQVAAAIRERLSSGTTISPTNISKPKKLKPSEMPDWQGFTLDDYCQLKKIANGRLRICSARTNSVGAVKQSSRGRTSMKLESCSQLRSGCRAIVTTRIRERRSTHPIRLEQSALTEYGERKLRLVDNGRRIGLSHTRMLGFPCNRHLW